MHLRKSIEALRRWRPGHYLRSSGHLFFWLILRAGIQVALIIALTRILSAQEYGSFVAVLAVATLFTPLAGLGMYSVLVRDGARNPASISRQLSAALGLWWRATILFGLLGVVATWMVLPNVLDALPLAVLVVGEIASSSLVELLARTEQARNRPQRYGAMNGGLSLARLAAIGLFALVGNKSLEEWIWFYTIASFGYAGALSAWMFRSMSLQMVRKPEWALLREGRPFLLAVLSLRVQAEVNKPVIAHTGLAAVGSFNIAQRGLDIAALPLNALQEVLTPRLFASNRPLRHAALPTAFIMGLAGMEAVVLWYGAPLLSYLFGPAYADVVWLVRALIMLPAAQALRNILGVAAVALDCANSLTGSYVTSMAASIGLNLWLVPAYGLRGAVAAIYATEGLTTIILATVLVHHYIVHRRPRV
jgi:O-antigen/teichoic acid export membrane protein